MAKPVTTRTIGPLHPEDLEPHRFEDLVRQLLYDFRKWRKLEATGRSGSDDGFDARGYEAVGLELESAVEADDDDEALVENSSHADRLWMIQCKREKSITPKKLRNYLQEIATDQQPTLYGLIFVAACNFSKAARDAFREETAKLGLSEAYLWGASDVEDMLFQPKNDHLLFAYFGLSLQTRRRSLRTEIRAKLATKRKCKKHLQFAGVALVRDPTDDRYPYLDKTQKERREQGRWIVYQLEDVLHDGVHMLRHRFHAFLDLETEEWDIAETVEDGEPNQWDNPWSESDDERRADPERAKVLKIWNALPDDNKAWFEVHFILPFENVLDIDDAGDEHFERPHVFTPPWENRKGPFSTERDVIELTGTTDKTRGGLTPMKGKRVKKFPRRKDGFSFEGYEPV